MASLKLRDSGWYVTWYEDGKKRAKSLDTQDEATAKKRLAIWNVQAEKAKWEPKPKDAPVADFWKSFEPWLKLHRSPAHASWVKIQWDHFIAELAPRVLSDAKKPAIEKLKLRWHKAGKAPDTINGFIRALRLTYNHAIKNGFYNGENSFSGLEFIPKKKTEKRALSKADFEKLYAVAVARSTSQYTKGIHLVFALGYYAGLRKEEICSAQWSWIDFKKGMITVRQDDHFKTKNGKDRSLSLSPTLAKILTPYRQDTGYIYLPDKPSGVNHRYRCDFKKAFSGICEKAEFDWVTPHTLRHSFATVLITTGTPIAVVSQFMGHGSIDVTVDIYGHLQTYHDGITAL